MDDNDIKLNYKSLRGNDGIAVFWKKTIDNAVKIKSDGGSRIQVITINNIPTMLCIVNVYMPSDIKEGDYEYRDMMDQLNEVIQKYEETYDILLCGDMNASLHRDDRRRDRIFKKFTVESNLILPTNYPIDFTFHHHNGKGKSQIDYILFKGKTLNLQPSVSIMPFDAINTSDHTLIKVEITTQISKLAPKSAKIYTKPAWDKCNSDEYKKIIQTEIRKQKNTIKLSVADRIATLENTLHKAGRKSIPQYRRLKTLKSVGRGIWNHNIDQASKEARKAHWIWKNKGNSNGSTESEKKDMIKKKRTLRQVQRQAYASKKDKLISEIMEASQDDSKTFHKLLRMQRSNSAINTDTLVIDNVEYNQNNIMEAWRIHFENLATPNLDDNKFDLERNSLCTIQNDIIAEVTANKVKIPPATEAEVKQAIRKLNNGKTADENGIQAEHFKFANAELATEICSITNQIFEELNIPDTLKRGILTPVLKKKKDKTLPGNYRGIVVTNTFSKIIESVIKERLEKQLSPTQNPLQRGFTEHASSKFTAFIASETILIYKKFNRDLELLTVDAEKAFDTVNHDIMLNKLYHDGITGDMWLLLRNIYDGLILKVKWGDQTTESIDIKQGIRQGAKLSTLLYKRYNNTILDSITKSTLGATIGNITVSAPACADDIALLGESKDIQAMLNFLEYNTKRDLVKLNPEKTEVINVSKALQTHPKKYVLGDQEINRVQSIKHLGITYQENGKINIEERLSIGRRTIYALLGPGLHARSGMSPVVLLKIWNTYAVPRYLYGLEIQAYTPLDTKKLEQLQRTTCRQFQCLPERTAAVAIYTLIGAEPIETTLDKNAMILFTTLARLDSSIEKDILIWEMENSKEEDRFFICRIRKTLQKYNLPFPEEILENPPKKQQWKNAMKKAINSFWYDKWTNEKQIKSTLEYLEIQQNPTGTPHNILRSVKNRKYDIQKAEIKLRLITDTYMLQYHHAKFSRNKISPICKLCGEEDEDRVHFLLECKTLEENRKTQMVKLGEALEEARGGGYMDYRTKWAAYANHLGLHLI